MLKFYSLNLLLMMFILNGYSEEYSEVLSAEKTKESTVIIETPGTVPGKCIIYMTRGGSKWRASQELRGMMEFSKDSDGKLFIVPPVTMARSGCKSMEVKVDGDKVIFGFDLGVRGLILYEGKSLLSGSLTGNCYEVRGKEKKNVGTFRLKHMAEVKDPRLVALVEALAPEGPREEAAMSFFKISSYSGSERAKFFMKNIGGQNYTYAFLTARTSTLDQLRDYYNFDFGERGAARTSFVAMHISESLWSPIFVEDLEHVKWITSGEESAEVKFDYKVKVGRVMRKFPLMARLVKKDGKWAPEKLSVPFPDSNDWGKSHLIYNRSQKVVIKILNGDIEKPEIELQNYYDKDLKVHSDWKLRCVNENGDDKRVIFEESLFEVDKKIFPFPVSIPHRGFLRFNQKRNISEDITKLKGSLYFELEMDDGIVIRTNNIWFE